MDRASVGPEILRPTGVFNNCFRRRSSGSVAGKRELGPRRRINLQAKSQNGKTVKAALFSAGGFLFGVLFLGRRVRGEAPALQDLPGGIGTVGEFEKLQIGLLDHALFYERREIDHPPPISLAE